MSENRSYLFTFPFSQENHYLGSKNIILFTPKWACECVFTSVACGNSHLCSILICHFRVYFQENWKIIFKIWPLKIAKRDQALTDWTMLVSSSQSSCKKKVLLSVYRVIINYLNYLKNMKSLVQFTGQSIKVHFMWLLISY